MLFESIASSQIIPHTKVETCSWVKMRLHNTVNVDNINAGDRYIKIISCRGISDRIWKTIAMHKTTKNVTVAKTVTDL